MSTNPGRQRIWEVDALRGLFLLGMLVIHFVLDIELTFQVQLPLPVLFHIIRRAGAAGFILLSGLCATLGSHPRRRGGQVLTCGLLISLVTGLAVTGKLAPAGFFIQFGILHLLGVCMLLYPSLRVCSNWALTLLGGCVLAVGCRFLHITVSSPLLFPLGLTCRHFSSLDYFPLLPFAGWFIWGIVLGRLLYASGKTRLPGHGRALPLRALRAIGRHSLPLYLLHQPVFFLLLTLYSRLIA